MSRQYQHYDLVISTTDVHFKTATVFSIASLLFAFSRKWRHLGFRKTILLIGSHTSHTSLLEGFWSPVMDEVLFHLNKAIWVPIWYSTCSRIRNDGHAMQTALKYSGHCKPILKACLPKVPLFPIKYLYLSLLTMAKRLKPCIPLTLI
jgi:hypothetical protein